MIIGFGSTEKQFETDLENKIKEHVTSAYSSNGDSYFTEAFCREIDKWVNGVAKESQERGELYKKAESHPDRYSYFWVSTVNNASHLVFILSIHHINRRHAFSPDGWALFQTKPLFCVSTSDIDKAVAA